jgi:hypothetical protein
MKAIIKLSALSLMVSLQSNIVICQPFNPGSENAQHQFIFINESRDNTPAENPKVARRFAELFPVATNQQWSKKADFFYVSFLNQGNKSSAAFTFNGHLNYAIIQLKSSDMPAKILKKINNTYPSYSIFNAKNIMADGINWHEIILENKQQYIVISVCQNVLEEQRTVLK